MGAVVIWCLKLIGVVYGLESSWLPAPFAQLPHKRASLSVDCAVPTHFKTISAHTHQPIYPALSSMAPCSFPSLFGLAPHIPPPPSLSSWSE